MSLLTRKILDAPTKNGLLLDYLAQPSVAPVLSTQPDATLGLPPAITGTASFVQSGEAINGVGQETYTSTAVFVQSGEAINGVGQETYTSTAVFVQSGERISGAGNETYTGTAQFKQGGEVFRATDTEVITGVGVFTESGESINAVATVIATGIDDAGRKDEYQNLQLLQERYKNELVYMSEIDLTEILELISYVGDEVWQ